MTLEGKTIIIGVCGSEVAYKAIDVIAGLEKMGASVYVIMTHSASRYLTPVVLRQCSQNTVIFSTEINDLERAMKVVKRADLFLVYPASAHIIEKMVNRVEDTVLSAALSHAQCPIWMAVSAEKTTETDVVKNIRILERRGIRLLLPQHSNGVFGKRSIIGIEETVERVAEELAYEHSMTTMNMMIVEYINLDDDDPLRYIKYAASNRIGYLLAHEARLRGASVTMIAPTKSAVRMEDGINFIQANNMENAMRAILDNIEDQNIVYTAFEPNAEAEECYATMSTIMRRGHGKVLIAGSYEEDNLIEAAKEKLKQLDAHILLDTICSFDTYDRAQTVLLTEDGDSLNMTGYSRRKIAETLINMILDKMGVNHE